MRVLAVDDHPLIIEIVRAVLAKAFPGAEVAVARSLEEALPYARRDGPLDFTVLDLGLPGCSGIDSLVKFRQVRPDTPTVVFSAVTEGPLIRGALEAGARGYVPKTAPPELLLAAIRLVLAGGTYIPPEALADLPADNGLSERQIEVLRLLARGLSNAEIARALNIGEGTVKQYLHAIFRVLDVSSRAEAMVAAARFGIRSS